MFEELHGRILKVGETRVWRTYKGGSRIDLWHGRTDSVDSNCSEDWIASTVQAVNPGREALVEGISRVLNHPDQPSLKEILEAAPEAWFGAAHVAKLGAQAGLLIKLIDAAERLTIQVHPDQQYAREVFGSEYGKTESWYILGGDQADKSPACVYIGFREGVTRALWQEVFEQQDITRMLECLHRIPVKAGDAFFIAGGVPHAIGAGCFLAEVQEPTDYTMRTELVTPGGLRIHESLCHQGAGFDKMLDCFHYDAISLEETLQRWKAKPAVLEKTADYSVESMIDERYTPLFSMRCIQVNGTYAYKRDARFSTFVVVSGSGSFTTERETIPIQQGDFLVMPACVELLEIAGSSLHLIESLPGAL